MSGRSSPWRDRNRAALDSGLSLYPGAHHPGGIETHQPAGLHAGRLPGALITLEGSKLQHGRAQQVGLARALTTLKGSKPRALALMAAPDPRALITLERSKTGATRLGPLVHLHGAHHPGGIETRSARTCSASDPRRSSPWRDRKTSTAHCASTARGAHHPGGIATPAGGWTCPSRRGAHHPGGIATGSCGAVTPSRPPGAHHPGGIATRTPGRRAPPASGGAHHPGGIATTASPGSHPCRSGRSSPWRDRNRACRLSATASATALITLEGSQQGALAALGHGHVGRSSPWRDRNETWALGCIQDTRGPLIALEGSQRVEGEERVQVGGQGAHHPGGIAA